MFCSLCKEECSIGPNDSNVIRPFPLKKKLEYVHISCALYSSEVVIAPSSSNSQDVSDILREFFIRPAKEQKVPCNLVDIIGKDFKHLTNGALIRGPKIKCAHCGKSGATMGCSRPECNNRLMTI